MAVHKPTREEAMDRYRELQGRLSQYEELLFAGGDLVPDGLEVIVARWRKTARSYRKLGRETTDTDALQRYAALCGTLLGCADEIEEMISSPWHSGEPPVGFDRVLCYDPSNPSEPPFIAVRNEERLGIWWLNSDGYYTWSAHYFWAEIPAVPGRKS